MGTYTVCGDVACQSTAIRAVKGHDHRDTLARTHGYLLLNQVPPTPALFSYITNSRFVIFCGNL